METRAEQSNTFNVLQNVEELVCEFETSRDILSIPWNEASSEFHGRSSRRKKREGWIQVRHVD